MDKEYVSEFYNDINKIIFGEIEGIELVRHKTYLQAGERNTLDSVIARLKVLTWMIDKENNKLMGVENE